MATGEYPGPTQPMIGAQLRLASEATHRELIARLRAAGYEDLRPVHFSLFVFPGLHGLRPTELAERVGMSKQQLNALLNELDELGYVTRQVGPGDGRHRVLALTKRGLAFAADMKRILQTIEQEIAEHVGQRKFARATATITAIAGLFPPPEDSTT